MKNNDLETAIDFIAKHPGNPFTGKEIVAFCIYCEMILVESDVECPRCGSKVENRKTEKT